MWNPAEAEDRWSLLGFDSCREGFRLDHSPSTRLLEIIQTERTRPSQPEAEGP